MVPRHRLWPHPVLGAGVAVGVPPSAGRVTPPAVRVVTPAAAGRAVAG